MGIFEITSGALGEPQIGQCLATCHPILMLIDSEPQLWFKWVIRIDLVEKESNSRLIWINFITLKYWVPPKSQICVNPTLNHGFFRTPKVLQLPNKVMPSPLFSLTTDTGSVRRICNVIVLLGGICAKISHSKHMKLLCYVSALRNPIT